jgi:hypothetical protein
MAASEQPFLFQNMESFLRRLKYYGIGFSIGLIFVFIFFQNRGCSWLPSNRVKNAFLDRVIVVSDGQYELLKSKGITENDITQVLNDGKVDFSQSDTEGDLKVYKLSKELNGKGVVDFFFTLPNESYLSEVFLSPKNVGEVKNSVNGHGYLIHFPNDDHMLFLDSSEALNCKLKELGFKDADALFKEVKKEGRIDFSKTNFAEKPKAIQYISIFENQKEKFGLKTIWYKNKINVVAIETNLNSLCP